MMKQILIALCFVPLVTFSQVNQKKPHINTIVSGGLLAGRNSFKPLFQSSVGLNQKHWFAGMGAGVDLYQYKSIPVYADCRYRLNKAFVYLNGGYNVPFGKHASPDQVFQTASRFHGGSYIDIGMGYGFRLGSFHKLLVSAGYTRKVISNVVGYTYPCFYPPCQEEKEEYHYTFSRIVTRLSWEFGR